MIKDEKQVYDLFKIVIIGDANVGKTSLANSYVNNAKLNPNRASTVAVDFYTKKIEYAGRQIKLMIWDTAGQERFRAITKTFYRDSIGALVCFSLINRKSFENLKQFIDELLEHSKLDTKIVLVGTFADMIDKRVVSQEEINSFIDTYGTSYVEISSKTGLNVSDVFLTLVSEIVQDVELGKFIPNTVKLVIDDLDDDFNENPNWCCG